MTELATYQPQSDMGAFDPDDANLLRYLQLNPTDPKARAVVAVCQRYNLDPVLKHVIVIPQGGAYITRDGLLHIAHRSGQLDGIVVDEEPHLVDGEWRARVSVYRKDMRFPFTFPGRYPENGGNKKYAQEMALKVAESHALRRAFDINGLPSYDEGAIPDARQTEAKPTGKDALYEAVKVERHEAEQPGDVDGGDPISDRTRARMFALLNDKGITDREQQIAGMVNIIGRPIESRGELTEDEGRQIIARLEAQA